VVASLRPGGRLAGRVAIVTGGARGIGRAIAEAYAAEGCAIVIGDVRAAEAVATCEAILASGGRALAVEADVADTAAADELAARALAFGGRVDILVNNAARYDGTRAAPLENLTSDEWDEMLTVNVRGVWNVTRAVVPAMRRAGYGKVVNLASGTVLQGLPFALHYVASKGAVVAMTRAMARELGPDGIRVNALAPGLTDTGASRRWEVPPERRPPLPTAALPGTLTPADLVGAAVFLASPESDAMTGQLLAVNLGTGFVG
jgi:NAD(P)-dependent dehydrogenase (short-subunit alcohol dehydrogenase family)